MRFFKTKNGTVHASTEGYIGAVVYYLCGGWSFWINLEKVDTPPTCPTCLALLNGGE